jgi:hypothetical protein
MAFKSFVFVTMGMFAFSVSAQQTTNQALQDCMNKVTARSAATGALIGGLLGAALGGDGKKNKSAAVGAGLGAAAGGLSGWQSSFKTCVDRVNVVTSRNAQSKDYQQTVEKYGYKGDGTLFKLEGIAVSEKVQAGTEMSSSFRLAFLKPDPTENPQVQVSRAWRCGNTEMKVKPEVFSVQQGTTDQVGRVAIPQADASIGVQQCEMLISLESEGLVQQAKRQFEIIPN